MKRRDATFLSVCLATVVGILVVGLVIALGVRRSAFDQGVKACVAAISQHDPRHDALVDLGRGEARFFFDMKNEWDWMQRVAEGAIPFRDAAGRVSRQCWQDDPKVWRELPFQVFSVHMLVRKGDHYTGAADPVNSPRTACGQAEEDYIRAYNAEMARLNPRSIVRYCK
ncbi:hypothetical protein [Novosphingobium sp. JCM 18896]|uniref:hypothetical protein n=1 Tax=Novosphingobium sp. JCM 18896 TaxID=2989731 RepID=UPI0022236E71|nr:hypothetical protein [Novosphingobium sp. JCM 18896]MCW1430605.1 hypothetical protein [Novosphingobium sp. JCM 18896]